MIDAWQLYALLCLLYLVECMQLLRKEQCFFRPQGGAWRYGEAAQLWGGENRRLLLSEFLPPFAGSFVARARWSAGEAAAAIQAGAASELQEQLAVYLRTTRFLRGLCALQFLFFFAVLPLLAAILESSLLVLTILAFSPLLSAAIAWQFMRSAKRLRFSGSRAASMVAILAYPPSSMRCFQLLARGFFAVEYPLTLASALSVAQMPALIERELRRRRYAPDAEKGAAALQLIAQLGELARRHNLDPDRLPLPEAGADGRCYCPQCLTVYDVLRETCIDCGASALPFPQSGATE
ncbi:MAG: hypothetical protein K1X75_05890 [Leptospirales bacterium]|nr:hypothetical protein [Leptospirales bacterium]